jgi:polysaccharide export outer membrane protein
MTRFSPRTLLAVFTIGLASACGSSLRGAVPVEQYKEPTDPAPVEYVIAAGDSLSIQVWDQPQMSGRVRVRSDGRVSLPFLNDVAAEGRTPAKLAAELEASFKSVVLNPRVTVSVEESKPLTISVIGEVARPGPQQFERGLGVAEAIAAAGGLTNFAKKDRIFVMRTRPMSVRIHFTYDALIRGGGAASAFRLQPRDVIIVE